jgi:hypothetical protein
MYCGPTTGQWTCGRTPYDWAEKRASDRSDYIAGRKRRPVCRKNQSSQKTVHGGLVKNSPTNTSRQETVQQQEEQKPYSGEEPWWGSCVTRPQQCQMDWPLLRSYATCRLSSLMLQSGSWTLEDKRNIRLCCAVSECSVKRVCFDVLVWVTKLTTWR